LIQGVLLTPPPVPEAGATHADFDGARGRAEDGQPRGWPRNKWMDWQKKRNHSTESLHMTGPLIS